MRARERPAVCRQCGAEFVSRPTRLGWTKFCSRGCHGEHKRIRPKRGRCKVCGTEFEQGAEYHRKTCSTDCERAAKAASKRGSANPNYQGERTNPLRWTSQKAKACASCGATARLQLHHVIYRQHIRSAGGDEHDPRNSLTVCISCHATHHHTGPLALVVLRPENYAYAAELMGPAAYDYLRRRYASEDMRLDRLLEEDPVRERTPSAAGTHGA